MKAVCIDSWNNFMASVQEMTPTTRMVTLSTSGPDSAIEDILSFVVSGTKYELDTLEGGLTVLESALTEAQIKKQLKVTFQVGLRGEGVLTLPGITFNSISAVMSFGMYRVSERGGAKERLELCIYTEGFDLVYGVCSLGSTTPLVLGDIASDYETWWKENKDVGILDPEFVGDAPQKEPEPVSTSTDLLAGIENVPFA